MGLMAAILTIINTSKQIATIGIFNLVREIVSLIVEILHKGKKWQKLIIFVQYVHQSRQFNDFVKKEGDTDFVATSGLCF